MPLVDSPHCNHSISIPPHLPLILKQFCKAAIRTQPYDLLKWSTVYFRALAEGIEPPTKTRLEYPLPGAVSGLTLGFLKILFRQFGDYNKVLPVNYIAQRWEDLCLDRCDLNLIMIIGRFRRKCQIKKFLAIAVGLLGTSLFDTMLMICELFTLEPDGGSAMLPVSLFMELYGYLAGLRCDGSKRKPSDEDPTEFVDYEPVTSSSQISEKIPEQKALSLNSQETDVDVELEHDNSMESTLKESSIEVKDMNTSASEVEPKETSSNDSSMDDKTMTKHKSEQRYHQKKKSVLPDELLTHYPNVPGIGPRLSSAQVTSLAVWLTDCSRRQEGMVGPRNLRHFNCPPLDLQEDIS